jgi:uncharacterized protein (TIGR02246 family)
MNVELINNTYSARCRPLRLVALALALAICVPLVAAANEKDAVTLVIERNIAAFRDFDADRVSGTYADDADWTNAFGVRQRGRADIKEYLTNLFARAQFRARAQSGPSEISVRFATPDVAIVHTFAEIVGQRSPNNEELPPRKLHRLMVLTKNAGEWLIVSELVMDERQDRISR